MKRFRAKPSMSLFACAACALGLLLWARLLLVSSPPRIATAQPAPMQPQPQVQPPKDRTPAQHTDGVHAPSDEPQAQHAH